MHTLTTINAPLLGLVISVQTSVGEIVTAGDVLLVLEVMKVQSSVTAPCAGKITDVFVEPGALVEQGSALMELNSADTSLTPKNSVDESNQKLDGEVNTAAAALAKFRTRSDNTLDAIRTSAADKRHANGYQTARENLEQLCDEGSFIEYGQFAVAAQRTTKDYEDLQVSTAADGILTGIAQINSDLFGADTSRTTVIVNDYSVMAGTQGYFHHKKLDRILAVAAQQNLPIIMLTEGGGGRPNDTDALTVNSGLQCDSFASWASLAGQVPRISIANGYNFAGNAALFGAADITIATKTSWIGMAGPAMIAGGGLGDFAPTDIGSVDIQSGNGVIDIVADDEEQAISVAKKCLAIFQGATDHWNCTEQGAISQHLPDNRRFAYQVRDVINTLTDTDSFIELKAKFGGAIVTGLARFSGKPVGIMANDCNVLGGAIDVDAGEKAADFLNLCNQFCLPVVSLCDTPGFMVGPDHEQRGAVRRLAKLFTAGAQLRTPLIAIVLRKCYGLGAQAMVGGSTSRPQYIASWPSGEFGPMGLEGAVQLGHKQQLEAETDPLKRKALFDQLLAKSYARGQAAEVASVMEIDAVIDPANTRCIIIAALQPSENHYARISGQ